ncbi:hypothetical protein NUW58_g8515 [Xylaria curta]|uniref:Uncharacterized protein n=1 Tax=Xylaria curta TaxID=42375 RepID=A0ACC1N7K3_9PEZI|nr:hypothetical protein NUW58_g8515 [Xylaria curta]
MRTYSTAGLLQALLLATTLQPAACSFSLDTIVKDWWYYVHNHLADTTSAACLAAYAAPIECDEVLLGWVSSNSPNFNPKPDDLESLKVCNQEGDAALVHTVTRPYPEVPVAVVGEVFQYQYAQVCAKNVSGWCYFAEDRERTSADFTCGNGCASQFFTNGHTLPGANYSFGVYELEYRSTWWIDYWAKGWNRLQSCREAPATFTAPYRPSSSKATTTSSSITEATSTPTSADESNTATPTPSESSSSSSQSEVPSTAANSTPTPTNNAGGKLRAPGVFRLLGWAYPMILPL